MDDLSLYRQLGMVPPAAPPSVSTPSDGAVGKRPSSMMGIDPSTLKPSATGRQGPTLDDLFSNVPRGKGDPWGDYMQKMQYLTQPPTQAGPDARRAMAGMPAGPRNTDDPVELKKPGAGQALMALLFGGGPTR